MNEPEERTPSTHKRAAEPIEESAPVVAASAETPSSEPPPPSSGRLPRKVPGATETFGSTGTVVPSAARVITKRYEFGPAPAPEAKDNDAAKPKPPSAKRMDTPPDSLRAAARAADQRFKRHKPDQSFHNEFDYKEMRRAMRVQAGLPAYDTPRVPAENIRSTSGELAARAGVEPHPVHAPVNKPLEHEPSVEIPPSAAGEQSGAETPRPFERPSPSAAKRPSPISVPRSPLPAAPAGEPAAAPAPPIAELFSDLDPLVRRKRLEVKFVMGSLVMVGLILLMVGTAVLAKIRSHIQKEAPSETTAPPVPARARNLDPLPVPEERVPEPKRTVQPEAPTAREVVQEPKHEPVAHDIAPEPKREATFPRLSATERSEKPTMEHTVAPTVPRVSAPSSRDESRPTHLVPAPSLSAKPTEPKQDADERMPTMRSL